MSFDVSHNIVIKYAYSMYASVKYWNEYNEEKIIKYNTSDHSKEYIFDRYELDNMYNFDSNTVTQDTISKYLPTYWINIIKSCIQDAWIAPDKDKYVDYELFDCDIKFMHLDFEVIDLDGNVCCSGEISNIK